MTTDRDSLLDHARRAGLSLDWTDATGRAQRVSDDSLRKVLKALGQDNDPQAHLDQHVLECTTATQGQGIVLEGQVPPGVQHVRVHLENGTCIERRVERRADGRFVLSGIDVLGYHEIECRDQRSCLIIAPTRAYTVSDAMQAAGRSPQSRVWGTAAQVYSLPASQ